MDMDALERIIGPAPYAAPRGAWDELRREFDVSLPPDFVAFTEAYGPGHIGDMLYVHHPVSPKLELGEFIREWIDFARQVPVDEIPYPVGLGEGELIPVASTSNGDIVYLFNGGADFGDWFVGVDSRCPDWFEYRMPYTDWVAALFSGTVGREYIADEWPPGSISTIKEEDFWRYG
ncbi:hypothetical protein [Yinghuangia soli]|uniref:SMI1/KNR4 family protein n=1 Tax=Yinghuangia soli TaxID=2908204 RepID=A0AA41PV21_9ACTN|nr:hypothetical protein [Yinghuangia soli]MCF2526241.1 hypothetical protein [Yinghuangia soli]